MPKWIIDPDHSCAAFSIRHLMITLVHGQFNRFAGTIHFDQSAPSLSSVELTIDAAGVYTGIQKRDEHLRSADFFDVEKFPEIRFSSTKVDFSGPSRCKITGDLTLHGVTRSIEFDAELSGPVTSPYGGEVCMGFAAQTRLNREDYGIMWNEQLEGGGVMVGREVHISLDIEADLAE